MKLDCFVRDDIFAMYSIEFDKGIIFKNGIAYSAVICGYEKSDSSGVIILEDRLFQDIFNNLPRF